MSATPVTFSADYVAERSRATTFFRLLLVIPHVIFFFLWTIAGFFAVVAAWFALVFTGRWPTGLYDFVANLQRYATHVYGYCGLLTDQYPPFGPSDDYPVRLNVGPPKDEYSRAKAGFRIFLAIPVYLIMYAMQIVWEIGALIAWFAIVITGKQPKGLQDMIKLGISYQQRGSAYIALVTEDFPPFTADGPALGAPPSGESLPPPPTAPESPSAFQPPQAPPVEGTPKPE
jgi:hypothetical protein